MVSLLQAKKLKPDSGDGAKGVGRPGMGKGAPFPQQSYSQATLNFGQAPMMVQTNKYLKSLSQAKKKEKMDKLDTILNMALPANYKEGILSTLRVCQLVVDEDLINNPDSTEDDSFFKCMILYFPQFSNLKEEIAMQKLCQSLCEFVLLCPG